MNLNFDINVSGRLELLDSSVLYAEEIILELGFGNTIYIKIYIDIKNVSWCMMKIWPDCDDVMPCIASTNITFWRITNLCPLQGTGGHGLDPGPQLTKVVHLALRFTG